MQLEADVVVVGAGPAGISAALAAAHADLRVLLVDSQARPGGTIAAAGLHSLCGLYIADTGDAVPVSPVAAAWISTIGASPRRIGRVHVLPLHQEMFSQAAEQLLAAQAGIRFQPRIFLQAGMSLRCRALVDATGQASMLAMLGYPTMKTEATCPGLGFVLDDVDMRTAPDTLQLYRHFASRRWPFFPTLVPGETDSSVLRGVINLDPGLQGQPAAVLTGLAREYLREMLADLRTSCPGFACARQMRVGERIGQRSGRVYAGPQRISGQQIAAGAHREAAVRAFWPVEHWQDLRGPRYVYPPAGGYGIPDACLRVSQSPAVFVAGLCVSATSAGQAAVRTAGACLETGHRVGRLAQQAALSASPQTHFLRRSRA